MALAPLQLGAASVYWLLVVPWLTINSKTPAKAALSLSLTSIIIQKKTAIVFATHEIQQGNIDQPLLLDTVC